MRQISDLHSNAAGCWGRRRGAHRAAGPAGDGHVKDQLPLAVERAAGVRVTGAAHDAGLGEDLLAGSAGRVEREENVRETRRRAWRMREVGELQRREKRWNCTARGGRRNGTVRDVNSTTTQVRNRLFRIFPSFFTRTQISQRAPSTPPRNPARIHTYVQAVQHHTDVHFAVGTNHV
jgi:hypothetical protein